MFRFIREIWSNFKEYIVLVILLLVSLISLTLNDHQSTKKIRTLAFGSFSVVSSLIHDYIKISDVKSENESLRRRNSELMFEISKLRDYGILNTQLKNLINLRDTLHYKLYPGAIVSKTYASSQSTFTINIGSKDSITVGMPVLNGDGFIGLIHSVSEDYSIVRNLHNSNLKVIVKDERSRFQGILRWNGSYLTVTNLPKTADINVGDRIITSELSSLVSIPIPVGIVKEVLNPEKGYFNDLIIEPLVDIYGVEYVFVLGLSKKVVNNNIELNFYRNP
jgi:rod shape-determining protein MreC